MDDFIVTVFMNDDDKPSELMTFGNNPEEVIDNMVQIEAVRILCHIKRVKDSEIWDFNEELEPFRELRRMILKTNGEIRLRLAMQEDS